MNQLTAELICLSKGAELKQYSENLAVDKNGELIQEIHVVAIVHPIISEIEIVFTPSLNENE